MSDTFISRGAARAVIMQSGFSKGSANDALEALPYTKLLGVSYYSERAVRAWGATFQGIGKRYRGAARR